jgi:hypothetical protein
MSVHEMTLRITVDDSKVEEPPEDWTGIHDVAHAYQDGVIEDGEITDHTLVQS